MNSKTFFFFLGRLGNAFRWLCYLACCILWGITLQNMGHMGHTHIGCIIRTPLFIPGIRVIWLLLVVAGGVCSTSALATVYSGPDYKDIFYVNI